MSTVAALTALIEEQSISQILPINDYIAKL
jgi:hypothetical protein